MARRRVLLGGIAWIATGLYFPANAAVASRWSNPAYDFRRDTISSLGKTSSCTTASGTHICSPWHTAANASWIFTGLAMLIGAVLAAPALPRDRRGRTGLWLVKINGVGLAIVGLDPDNLRPGPHAIGAAMALLGGNLALVTLGLALRRADLWPRLGTAGLACGIAGLTSLVLMQTSPGADTGLLERIAGDPVIAWYLALGIALVLARRISPGSD
jgi:hypothetical membrane protein